MLKNLFLVLRPLLCNLGIKICPDTAALIPCGEIFWQSFLRADSIETQAVR